MNIEQTPTPAKKAFAEPRLVVFGDFHVLTQKVGKKGAYDSTTLRSTRTSV